VNYHRERLHEFRLLAERFVHSQENTELSDLLDQYTFRVEKLRTDPFLRKGLIHGDPVYKNFLLSDGNIVAWIDYDMMSVTTQLWDLADMYRGYAKIPEF
jgi:thiamine kinase-like enzyme